MRCYRASNCCRNPQPLWRAFENPRPCERSTRGTQVHPRVRFEIRARFARNRGVPVRCCSIGIYGIDSAAGYERTLEWFSGNVVSDAGNMENVTPMQLE